MIKSIYVKDMSNNGTVLVKRVKPLNKMTTQEIMLTGFGMFR